MYFKVITTSFLLLTLTKAERDLNEVFVWKLLNFGRDASDNEIFKEKTGFPVDVDVYYTSNGSMRVFTTIPRLEEHIPFTLATISDKYGPDGPIIYAYPSYEWHNISNSQCTGITSAFRVKIDECGHMWVIDSGVIADNQICPPQLLTFDLNTDELINRFQFTPDLYTPNASLFITPAIDTRDLPPSGRCEKVMVYIADKYHGLVVYDSHKKSAWRIENKLMYPDENWRTFSVAGEKFDLMFGTFAVTLKPKRNTALDRVENTCQKNLYFHSLSSDAENSVPLCLIDNQKIWQDNSKAMPEAFKELGRRGVQSGMEAMDSKGNLFAGTYDPLKIFVWNINTIYTNNSFKTVADNQEQLQVTSGLKVIRNPHGYEELWVLTMKFQKFKTGTLNPNVFNFRIMTCKIDDLLSGKGCKKSGKRISKRSIPFHACRRDSCKKN